MGLPEDTQKAFKHEGKYTPERAALHEKIMASFLEHVPGVPRGRQPVAVVMMGGPASGKSTVVKHLLGEDYGADFVNVNPDDVKDHLPEYLRGIGAHGGPSARDAAASVHEESSEIAEEIRKLAVSARKNLVLDGTGKNAEKYAAKLEQFRAAGYHVRLVMVHTDMDAARERAAQRSEHKGRWVPDAFVEEAHHVIPGNFEKIAKAADEAVLVDNNGQPPKVALELEGSARRVRDEKFVKQFEEDAAYRHKIARERGWMKAFLASLVKASKKGKLSPSVTLEDMLKRLQRKDVGEVEDNSTGIEDAEDLQRFREEAAKPEPAPQAMHKGLYFEKAERPPAGFEAAPHSHHGGFRRRVNGDWVYWYPGQGVLRATAAREHFARVPIEQPAPAPTPTRMAEGAQLAPFAGSRADINKNPGLYKMEHGKFRWHSVPGKDGEPSRLEPDVDDRTKAQLVGEYAPLISKEARAALKLHALKATHLAGGGKEGNQTLLDLQRAGVEGLLNAVRAYRGGQPFGMYAQSYVRGYARLEAGRQGRLHLSERHAANLRRYVAARVRAQAMLGEADPSPEQVAKFYDLRLKHVHGGLGEGGEAPVPMEGYDLGQGRRGGQGPLRGAEQRRGRLAWAQAYDAYLRGEEVELGDAEAAASATQEAPDAEERAAAKEQVSRALKHIAGLKGGVEVTARAPGRYESEARYKVDDAADLLRRRLGLGEHEEHTTNRLAAEVPVYRKAASGEWKRVSERAARERMDQIVEAAMAQLRDAVRGLRKSQGDRFPELTQLLSSPVAWLPGEWAPFVTLGLAP